MSRIACSMIWCVVMSGRCLELDGFKAQFIIMDCAFFVGNMLLHNGVFVYG